MGVSLLARKLLFTGLWAWEEPGAETLAQQLAFAAGPAPVVAVEGRGRSWMVGTSDTSVRGSPGGRKAAKASQQPSEVQLGDEIRRAEFKAFTYKIKSLSSTL